MRDLKGREGEEEEGEGRQEGREGCWSANDQIVQVLMLACSLSCCSIPSWLGIYGICPPYPEISRVFSGLTSPPRFTR